MRILVVDDHEVVRRGICAILACRPELTISGEAADGREAVEKALAMHPDLVVMDISMPNVNGLEATREIKKRLPDTSVVIVSQHAAPEMVRQAFGAGATSYVVKSAISQDLLSAIEKIRLNKPSLELRGSVEDQRQASQEIVNEGAALEKSRASEEIFRSAINNMAEAICMLDDEGRVSYANPAAEAMFGWTAAELLGKRMHDVTHYKHADGTPFPAGACVCFQVLESGLGVKDRQDTFIRKDGSLFPAVLSASPLTEDGKTSGVVVCLRHDTRRKEVEEALRRSEPIYQAIGESLDYGIWICDANGRNIYASPSFLKLVGLTQEQCSEFGWKHVLHPEDADATIAAWKECVRNGTFWEREHRVSTVEGKWRHILARGGPILDAEGKVTFWAGINLDIQHRKESEVALETRIAERTDELQRASDELRRLSGTLLQTQDEERRRIARELHDGIGQILAALNMSVGEVDAEKERLPEAARESLQHSTSLIQQAWREIRTMSHLLHPPLLDEVGLESALQWYVDGFGERGKIKVTMQASAGFSQGLPHDLALTLFRIVQECLTNVYRHSESKTAYITISRSAEEIVLEVRDEGKGIPLEIQGQVSSGESLGVGLRGMRERARQFDGRLDLYSTAGETRIRAAFPIKTPPAEQGASEVDEMAVGLSSASSPQVATILCVEDEHSSLMARKLLLESAGHRVLEASSGSQGIQLFQSQAVDLVILDYWMSGMKGTTVAAEMKRINPSIPILVLSGVSDLPGEASGWVDQWLVKGTHRAEHFLDSVSTLLEQRFAARRICIR